MGPAAFFFLAQTRFRLGKNAADTKLAGLLQDLLTKCRRFFIVFPWKKERSGALQKEI